MGAAEFDDPIWEYVLATKLQEYIPAVREWWSNVEDIVISGTGVYPIHGDNVPPGLMYRMTNTPVRSPIKHVQVFPFVPVSYLQITNVSGGAQRMVSRVCSAGFTLDEFSIIEKHNLPSTYHQGQFIAFIPTHILEDTNSLGRWVYLTRPEMYEIMRSNPSGSLKQKLVKCL